MLETINNLTHSRMLFKMGVVFTVVFTILLLILLFVNTSRDERGRAIIGRASILSTITFIVFVNIFAKISSYIEIDYLSTANIVQWIYNIVIMIEVFAIVIYKKIS